MKCYTISEPNTPIHPTQSPTQKVVIIMSGSANQQVFTIILSPAFYVLTFSQTFIHYPLLSRLQFGPIVFAFFCFFSLSQFILDCLSQFNYSFLNSVQSRFSLSLQFVSMFILFYYPPPPPTIIVSFQRKQRV